MAKQKAKQDKNPYLAKVQPPVCLSRGAMTAALAAVNGDPAARGRVWAMATAFRDAQVVCVENYKEKSEADEYNFSPWALGGFVQEGTYRNAAAAQEAFRTTNKGLSYSTSLGKVIESAPMEVYGWQWLNPNKKEDREVYQILEGTKVIGGRLWGAQLKGGGDCTNLIASEGYAACFLQHISTWAKDYGVDKVGFMYGNTYGTPKKSNKKEHLILRNVADAIYAGRTGGHACRWVTDPAGRWDCEFYVDDVNVKMKVANGKETWDFISEGVGDGFTEVLAAYAIASCSGGRGERQAVINDMAGGDNRLLDEVAEDLFFRLATRFCNRMDG